MDYYSGIIFLCSLFFPSHASAARLQDSLRTRLHLSACPNQKDDAHKQKQSPLLLKVYEHNNPVPLSAQRFDKDQLNVLPELCSSSPSLSLAEEQNCLTGR